MRIVCPHCGERDHAEFVYQGDATVSRPDPNAGDAAGRFHEYVHLRSNPAGWHKEHWYHAAGCRSFILVERNTLTHETKSAKLTRPWRMAPETEPREQPSGRKPGKPQ